jgi:hypothetical protein
MPEAYAHALRHSGLDFATIAHQQNSVGLAFGQKQWVEYLELNDEYNEQPDFATFVGFEHYMQKGHRIAYFRSREEAEGFRMSADRPDDDQLEEAHQLWGALGDTQTFTVPHHCRFLWPTDFSIPPHPKDRVAEICSRWGRSESPGPHSLQHALRLGHRLGFIGGTDNHLGQPGNGPFEVNQGRGIAAVYAHELTREALWDAVYARRCYATSGEQILLYFALDEHLMGSELTDYAGRRTFAVRAAGTQPLRAVELVRNGEVIHRVEPGELTFEDEFVDDTALESTWLQPAFPNLPPFCYYYARIHQLDGESAWSSPIWIAA